jgi:hypothetical protein
MPRIRVVKRCDQFGYDKLAIPVEDMLGIFRDSRIATDQRVDPEVQGLAFIKRHIVNWRSGEGKNTKNNSAAKPSSSHCLLPSRPHF